MSARFGLIAGLLLAGPVAGAPITFNTALPVHEGGFVLREQWLFLKNADDPSPAGRDMEVNAAVSVLGYGVTRDFALFGMLPWFDKRLAMDAGDGRITRQQSGFGDLTLLARYTAVERNAPGKTFRIAPFLGVEAPTGQDKARDRLGRLPPPLQPGSGAWDWLGGVVVTRQTLDWQFDAQASWQRNGEANGFRAGEALRLDGSLQYRLWPRELETGLPSFVYGVLEINAVQASRDRHDGIRDPDSGGTRVFVTPGLQYVTRTWIVEAAVQIPVHQDLNGMALKNDHTITASVRRNF